MGDGHLPAVLDKICNGLCGFGNRCLLFRKIGSQGVVAQGQYKSLLPYGSVPFTGLFYFSYHITFFRRVEGNFCNFTTSML